MAATSTVQPVGHQEKLLLDRYAEHRPLTTERARKMFIAIGGSLHPISIFVGHENRNANLTHHLYPQTNLLYIQPQSRR